MNTDEFKKIEKIFIDEIKDKLKDKEFIFNGKFPLEIPCIVGNCFALKIFQFYENLTEYDVKPLVRQNILYIKISTNNDTKILADILITTNIENDLLTIKDVLVSLKNFKI